MFVWHWLIGPITGADYLSGLLLFGLIHRVYTRRLVLSEWERAKGKLNLEVQQLKQRRNLAEIAARQAEEKARG